MLYLSFVRYHEQLACFLSFVHCCFCTFCNLRRIKMLFGINFSKLPQNDFMKDILHCARSGVRGSKFLLNAKVYK